ncbi:MAG TPA: SPOR domain-containing protein [Chitinivibrionales bacterium]|jgi:tetratricopeptide (TPR) repeat protein|nr:SPOR domain-containing protein [Chitinivibrionales bacterium]
MIRFNTSLRGNTPMRTFFTMLLRPCSLSPLLVAVVSSVASGSIAGDSRDLLCKGDIAGARAVLEKAGADSAAVPEIALLWARTMDNTDSALQLYKRIAREKSAPDSVRAEAYFLLGCAAYLRRGPGHKASGYFGAATDLSAGGRYVEPRYLSFVRDTADTALIAQLEKAAKDTASGSGPMASFYLGLFHYVKKDFTRALSCFTAGAAVADTASWACAANAGAYACASAMARPEEASAILTHIRRAWGEYLERSMLARVKQKAPSAKKDSAGSRDSVAWLAPDTAKKPPLAQTAQKPVYFLQVGAFGTMENAHGLKVKLAAQFPLVDITQANAGGKPIFRVHVGSFDSQDKARAYGDSALAKKGIKFTVVEK